ncbi:hypothetical protein BDV96DRAFT_676594 [Lophiotrema nucula]|uniref:LysM domain-containing protein n=1 Tax=Lophiotrema nucula TaxID=690887 RepID=A0A6A5ZLJ0_9PLEO|nr:hypothetical protein BDV96DRAFT_676594 [Lophiotrema nucula]
MDLSIFSYGNMYDRRTQLEIDEPLNSGYGMHQEDFNSLLESCGIATTSYTVTPTNASSTSTATSTCETKIIADAGQTINSIAKDNSVSTDRLLQSNRILPLLNNDTLTEGEVICLDGVSKCLIRQVTSGDTCDALVEASGKGVNIIMFKSWNPTVGYKCMNLPFMVGKYICISPLSSIPKPIPTNGTNSSTTQLPSYSWNNIPNSASSAMNITGAWIFPTEAIEIQTHSAELPPDASISAIIARISNCPFLKEHTEDWEIGLDDDEYRLHSWDLPVECQELWEPYCTPNPTAPILSSPTTIASSCYPTVFTIIPDGWVNPPASINNGTADNCNKWHVVSRNDTCAGLEARYGITHESFTQWNPAVNADCRNLMAQFAYCTTSVAGPTSPTRAPTTAPTATMTTTPKTNSNSPPAPTQSGTDANCTQWHMVKAGDCGAIQHLCRSLLRTQQGDQCCLLKSLNWICVLCPLGSCV